MGLCVCVSVAVWVCEYVLELLCGFVGECVSVGVSVCVIVLHVVLVCVFYILLWYESVVAWQRWRRGRVRCGEGVIGRWSLGFFGKKM